MTDDGQFPGGILNPGLARLLAVTRRIFGGSAAWLELREPERGETILLGEEGLLVRFADTGDPLSGRRYDSAGTEALFPGARAEAERRELVLGAAASVPETTGAFLLLAGNERRELSEPEWELFEALADQSAVVLERNALLKRVDRASRAAKEARESLTDMRRDFDLLTARVLEVICKVDREGFIQFVNTPGGRILGYRQGDLIGRNVCELIQADDRRRAEQALEGGRKTGHFEVEIRCRCGDGDLHPFLFFGAALRDDDPVGEGFFIGGRNIGRRRKAEAELRRLQGRFQSVWENSRDAMRLTDSHGTVLQVNDAYCRLVAKSRSEVIGYPFVVAYQYEDPRATLERFRKRLVTRTMPDQLDLELTLWNGDPRVFQLSNSLFEMEDETILLTIYHDITERRKKEEELNRLNEALRQRANHLGALTLQLTRVEQEERRRLAEVLHDHLQQLLVAARMGMERVRLRATESVDVRSLLDLEHLLDESIKASRSITMELCPPVLYDGGLMVALEWLGRRMLDKHGLHVRIEGGIGGERLCEVLRVFLFQAIRELLFNCCQHAAVDEVEVRVEPAEGRSVRIVVRDEGRGFDATCLKPDGTGTGERFGLFSLRERIGHIGGTMEVRTAPGEGTTITLVAPFDPDCLAEGGEKEPVLVRHAPVARIAKPGDPAGDPGRKRDVRLVLVDDHKIMRQGLRELLREQEDMVVIGEAENGLEGVKLAQDLQPDVVVMDVSMPIMNGVEATRVLAAELPDIKVIGLSMHVKEDMATAILEAGASAYVTKSTAAETLTGTIRKVAGIGSGRKPGGSG